MMEKSRREAQKIVPKRVMEHEDICAHCGDHVLKATVRVLIFLFYFVEYSSLFKN